MASSVEELLDMLSDIIEDAKSVPFSSDRCMLERDKALDLLDDIKARYPVEFKKSKEIVSTKNNYLASAKREADALRQDAEDHAKQVLSKDSLVHEARRMAEEMLLKAEEQSRQMKRMTNEYCEDMLSRLEDDVADVYDEIKDRHTQFRGALGAGGSSSRMAYDAYDDDDDI